MSFLNLDHGGFESNSNKKFTPAALQILTKDVMAKPNNQIGIIAQL